VVFNGHYMRQFLTRVIIGEGRNGSFDGEERTDARLHGTWSARVARAGHGRGRGWLGVGRSAVT
jgi:hypothetical protein